MITYLLLIIFSVILIFPLAIKKVERNLEVFLLIMATVTLTLSHLFGPHPLWGYKLLLASIIEPIKLAVATLIFGFIFKVFREPLKKKIISLEEVIGPRMFAFMFILIIGIVSSVITAIIAALVLAEVVSALNMDEKYERIFVILACFSIGMGAALTPLGEPLSTIALAKLKGGRHQADFLFLMKLIGVYILPGLFMLAILGSFFRGTLVSREKSLSQDYPESFGDIALRAWKVYIFVMALILLGEGFKPLIDSHISQLPGASLYWVNMTSAVLDNATLAAAELGPHMTAEQIKGILMGIVISGGILIPGNIPNIISASKLRISSRAWAVVGVPVGLSLLGLYYVALFMF